uniref:Uncharacterized protein n=1 Tax=Anguilla anguilla TaxID=7936 RepID=A0A0E9VRU6_ANGAN
MEPLPAPERYNTLRPKDYGGFENPRHRAGFDKNGKVFLFVCLAKYICTSQVKRD